MYEQNDLHDVDLVAVRITGNDVARISVVALCRAVLFIRWVTICTSLVQRQLSLAIPPLVGVMSAGDRYDHRYKSNGEFCVVADPVDLYSNNTQGVYADCDNLS